VPSQNKSSSPLLPKSNIIVLAFMQKLLVGVLAFAQLFVRQRKPPVKDRRLKFRMWAG
jgi:hypothetical protein